MWNRATIMVLYFLCFQDGPNKNVESKVLSYNQQHLDFGEVHMEKPGKIIAYYRIAVHIHLKKYQKEISNLKEELDQLRQRMIGGVKQEEILTLKEKYAEGQSSTTPSSPGEDDRLDMFGTPSSMLVESDRRSPSSGLCDPSPDHKYRRSSSKWSDEQSPRGSSVITESTHHMFKMDQGEYIKEKLTRATLSSLTTKISWILTEKVAEAKSLLLGCLPHLQASIYCKTLVEPALKTAVYEAGNVNDGLVHYILPVIVTSAEKESRYLVCY
ncbi:hypothetical protein MKW98_000559 [Papaver atlanticum]|uniref:Uncharacterized protein n=1 Tax=Papaver atlanticum TaxID=357466 RepID=A0AAD4S456_9MAGN|nr:hypothetical protein MKW98_000559 [Papaver atlanticum]